LLQSAHDCSDGGLAIALAECSFDAPDIGLEVNLPVQLPPGGSAATLDPHIGTLFGESASRAVVSVRPEDLAPVLQMAADAGIPARALGETGGDRLRIAVDGESVVDCTVAEAERAWASALGERLAGRAA
jgi:phosphoribosylformylglycinamidine synthase